MKSCTICKEEFDTAASRTAFAEAGEWLAEEIWRDAGELCPRCLENRGMLAMMYCHDLNT
jgi:hypothetical protein